MGAFQTLLSVAGWTFIPDQFTNFAVQTAHQHLFPFLRISPPQPGTSQYRKHYRYTFAVAVLGFLLYSLIQSAMSMRPSFYELMQVAPDIDDNGLKQAFRQFAKRNHPDRVGPQGEKLFIMVRDAFEALKDPVVRYAYDRFGPDVLKWTDCTTPRHYLKRGLTQSIGFHVVSLLGILFWSAVGSTPLPFWRYTLYLACFATELSLIVHASPSSGFLTDPTAPSTTLTLFHFFLPRRVQYQHIQYLHQILVFLNVALSRVAPRVFPDDIVLEDIAAIKAMRNLVSLVEREASVLLKNQTDCLRPLPESPLAYNQGQQSAEISQDLINELSTEMEKLIIETNLRKDAGPLKSAWDNAVEKAQKMASSMQPGVMGSPTRFGTLPSPISPSGTPGPDDRPSSPWRQGKIPFPVGRSPNYVRGRSISY